MNRFTISLLALTILLGAKAEIFDLTIKSENSEQIEQTKTLIKEITEFIQATMQELKNNPDAYLYQRKLLEKIDKREKTLRKICRAISKINPSYFESKDEKALLLYKMCRILADLGLLARSLPSAPAIRPSIVTHILLYEGDLILLT